MRLKILCLVSSLLLLFCFVHIPIVYAAVILDPQEGTVGSDVTVENLTSGETYLIKWDEDNYDVGIVPSSGTITFEVPDDTGTIHNVTVESPVGDEVLSTVFEILPSITIDPDSGAVGTEVSVSGNGFRASEANVKIIYDDDDMVKSITADSKGSWSKKFPIPASAAGDHSIDASGGNTSASNIDDQTFEVTPSISITPASGGVGTKITVKGLGFTSNETAIKVFYDSTIILSEIGADAKGSWSSAFNVPSSAKGEHQVDASGNTTEATDIPNVKFTVSPGITVDKESGFVDDTIKINGSGFNQNESGITVTFDSDTIESSIVADSAGQWSASSKIPAATGGTHTIDAYGTTTAPTAVANKSITVKARIILTPKSGNVGDTIDVSGSGFSKSEEVNVTYAGSTAIKGVTTDTAGSFSGNITAPPGKSGEIKVEATDAAKVTASATFTMETTPPAPPQIKAPSEGSTVGFIGDAKADFDWSDVSDPSGVIYDLQVSENTTFNKPVIEHTSLTQSEYKSTDNETLKQGGYFWRVRAVDLAGNTSNWTGPISFKAGYIGTWTLIIIIVVIVVALIAFRAIMVFGKNKK